MSSRSLISREARNLTLNIESCSLASVSDGWAVSNCRMNVAISASSGDVLFRCGVMIRWRRHEYKMTLTMKSRATSDIVKLSFQRPNSCLNSIVKNVEWLSATAIGSQESSPSDEMMWISASVILLRTLVSCISVKIELVKMNSLETMNKFVGNS